ncbi:MAG: PfkB family carbohydrate kinase [Patescibacteria group bacterium]|nr:PfkB family carbohydrate kinase [Patescibacteria group bacterium]
MNILIFGHVCLDRNIVETGESNTWGSPVMFISTVLQQLPDASVTIVSNYGSNYLPYLKDRNIYPEKPSTESTLTYRNFSQGRERGQKALNRGYSEPVEIDENLKGKIENADIIFFAPILPNFSPDYVKKALSLAKKDVLKILLPQGYFRDFDQENNVIFRAFPEALEVLPLMNFVILSDQDFPNIEEVVQGWIEKTNVKVILTRGEDGASVISQEGKREIPTTPVPLKEIVDSTGSGDTFSAGFAYQYFLTKDEVKSVQFAHKLATAKLYFTPENIKFDYPKLLK